MRDGEVSALELVDAAIARLEGAPELNVLVHADFEAARAAAARRPRGDGPLAGVPFLLKDLGEPQAGVPERMGSRALRDHIATETALSVQRYRAAGLIICGRTNTPEFGNHCATEPSLFGPTLNPWDHKRSPGGSSGAQPPPSPRALSEPPRAAMAPARSGCQPRAVAWSASSHAAVELVGTVGGTDARWAGVQARADPHRPRHRPAARRHGGSVPGDPYAATPPRRPLVDEVGADPGTLRVMFAEGPPFPVASTNGSRTSPTAPRGRWRHSGTDVYRGCPARSRGRAPRRSR